MENGQRLDNKPKPNKRAHLVRAKQTQPKQPPRCKCHGLFARPHTTEVLPSGHIADRGKILYYNCQVTGQRTEVTTTPFIDPSLL